MSSAATTFSAEAFASVEDQPAKDDNLFAEGPIARRVEARRSSCPSALAARRPYLIATTTITQLADSTGVTPRALRHYEARGLLRPVRVKSGERRYTAEEAAIARTIVLLRSLDISIAEIGRLIDPDRQGAGRTADLRRLLLSRDQELKHRLDRVQTALSELDANLSPFGT